MDKKIAIIDLGSNSLRMIIMRIYDDDSYKLMDQVKDMVRLSEGMGSDMILKPQPMERTLNALKLFKRLIKIHRVEEVYPIATAAIRNAKNQQAFLDLVKDETGLQFQIISGEKEAYYGYLGIINTLDLTEGLTIDVGGGSTEIGWIKNRRLKRSVSIPYGSMTLTEIFLHKEVIEEQAIKSLENFIRNQFKQIDWLKETRKLPVIGLGGTARTLAKINMHDIRFPLEILHNYQMTYNEVLSVYEKVNHGPKANLKDVGGISKNRIDIITAGIVPITALMEYTNSQTLTISGNGLREGVFYENYLQKTHQREILEDVLFHSITNIIKNYDMNLEHCHQVKNLALTLFDETHKLHGLSDQERKLLAVSALIHDIGIHLDYYNHHKHGFYLTLSVPLNGLSNKERVICAFLVAMHRENSFKGNWKNFNMLINHNDYKIIKKLSIFLKIAEKLDRGESSSIEKLRCNITKDTVTLLIHSSLPVALEVSGAMEFENLFRKNFKKNLCIKVL
ncbi:exopolyphosphatase [Serpentinicella alkaliphila]|uniref:Exopolyphosphatase n=1 Tax=Serpentinicella alkaliphila TaxID=1734049 RepID=A0A4R2T166_9FIRM|nr:exopolyphosphatase [Serpentinicella alkaliphila]QUH25797.1 exopolyphosphatase [Serpentinicella alkaliphila]TCP95840.1 Ppx/GppA phosphatase [Serpentinicella alkaliphila]